MATKAIERLKARLAENPLYFRKGECVPTCQQCCGGAKPEGGKKLALYQVTNYTNVAWNMCHVCKKVYRAI